MCLDRNSCPEPEHARTESHRSLRVVKFTRQLPAGLARGQMVIKKVMALFRPDAKPQETFDVYDVEGLCDAIDEVVKRRKQLPGRGTPFLAAHK
jgi:hypothetical protein